MKVSVIIPARNAAFHLDHLLSAIMPQLLSDDECVLVDDASADETVEIARRYGVSVVAVKTRSGPAAARNLGASHSSGDLLVFLDADVVPQSDLLQRMRQQMQDSPELSALMGSYDANPYEQSTVSRFRNLLHCYTHNHGNQDASTFWAGCGAIRRSAFVQIGGFDASRFPEPSIEDIEMGLRLKRSGGRIRLDPSLCVQHRKAWSLRTMLRTDLMQRAIPWTKLILESGKMPLDLNLKASQRISGVAAVLLLAMLLLIPWSPVVAGTAALVLLAMVLTLNAAFYRFLASRGGWWFAVRSVPFHLLYFLCGGVGYGWGCGSYLWGRNPKD